MHEGTIYAILAVTNFLTLEYLALPNHVFLTEMPPHTHAAVFIF